MDHLTFCWEICGVMGCVTPQIFTIILIMCDCHLGLREQWEEVYHSEQHSERLGIINVSEEKVCGIMLASFFCCLVSKIHDLQFIESQVQRIEIRLRDTGILVNFPCSHSYNLSAIFYCFPTTVQRLSCSISLTLAGQGKNLIWLPQGKWILLLGKWKWTFGSLSAKWNQPQ